LNVIIVERYKIYGQNNSDQVERIDYRMSFESVLRSLEKNDLVKFNLDSRSPSGEFRVEEEFQNNAMLLSEREMLYSLELDKDRDVIDVFKLTGNPSDINIRHQFEVETLTIVGED